MNKNAKVTVGNMVEEFLIHYAEGLKRDYIKKPIAWALYQTWLWADKNEKVRIKDDETVD